MAFRTPYYFQFGEGGPLVVMLPKNRSLAGLSHQQKTRDQSDIESPFLRDYIQRMCLSGRVFIATEAFEHDFKHQVLSLLLPNNLSMLIQ